MKERMKHYLFFFLLISNASYSQSVLKNSDTDWGNESFLQKLVDLDPLQKQYHVYEEILKIKPQSIWTHSNARTRVYTIKGCTFEISTDLNDNVIEYKLQINKYCPSFEFNSGNEFSFNSETINFQKIFSDLEKSCFPPRFTTDYLNWTECGQTCNPDWNLIITNITRCGDYREMKFIFEGSELLKKWREQVLSDNGGLENYTKNCKLRDDGVRCDPNPNGIYDKYAIQLIGEQRPSEFIYR